FESGGGMSLHLHIERLVLEGLTFSSHDTRLVQAGVEAKLLTLFSDNGPRPSCSLSLSHLRGKPFHLNASRGAVGLGQAIAGSLHATFRERFSLGPDRKISPQQSRHRSGSRSPDLPGKKGVSR